LFILDEISYATRKIQTKMWSFNRLKDASNIKVEEIQWQGPFSWPGYENQNNLCTIPDIEGLYLFTFTYNDGYLVYAAGITNSTKKRIKRHHFEYKKGNYTVLDVSAAENGERQEIWHGWQYAKTHQEEFIQRKEEILTAVDEQLKSFRIFVAQVTDKRTRERIEAAIMHNIYYCREPWAELACRGMLLRERYNAEMPIEAKNISNYKIYGLPETLEI
jgi:hypothetical protein